MQLRNPARTVDVPGPLRVGDLLARLDLNPETVLVITAGELVTKDAVLADEATVEVRPVISGGAGPARCSTTPCRRASVIEVPRHRGAWCAEHFVDHVHRQVREAIDRHRMLSYGDRILVAVSGGKDSLALWDVLLAMGYRADGLYLGLGIGDYSDRSHDVVRAFAADRDARLHVVDLATEHGFDIPRATVLRNRSSCGVCGLSKRYVFNRVALEHGYDVMATGHNLDDEAAQLLGNVLRWQTPFLARQSPALPASGGLAKKVKPLYRLGEREMAAYCVVRGIDYVVEECPLVGGNTVLRYKDALNELERHSPGTKATFLFGFLDRVRDTAFAEADAATELVPCASCGLPTTTQAGGWTAPSDDEQRVDGDRDEVRCAFCRTQGRLLEILSRPPRTRSGAASPAVAPSGATA